ncbi:flagellar hook-length control protein FliK [Castellaniella caeni]
MNIPVLPVSPAAPAPAETAARPAEADDSTAAFSNVLSSQRAPDTAAPHTGPSAARGPAKPDDADKQAPMGPEETLAFILSSTTLPLMQAAAQARPAQAAADRGLEDAAQPAADNHRPGKALATLAAPAADALVEDPAPQRKDSAAAAPQSRVLAALAAPDARGGANIPAQAAVAAPGDPAASRATSPARGGTPGGTSLPGSTVGTRPGEAVSPASTGLPTAAPRADGPLPDTSALQSAAAPAGASLLNTPATAPAAAPLQATVATPLGNAQWTQDFSRQVLNLAQTGTSAGGHTVLMHVNPPELGPIHITLHIGDNLAQASFVSPHANVRQALESALPHLEQQLAQAGLSLGQANVSDQQAGQQSFAQTQQSGHADKGVQFSLDGGFQVAPEAALASSGGRAASRPDALVDTFV